MRAQWDGKTLCFRGGGSVPAPAWFTAGFPATPLYGERWVARDGFDALSGTLRKLAPVDAEWRQVRYLIFELPGATDDFSTRIQQMNSLVVQTGVPWLWAVEQFRVAGHAELMRRLDSVTKAGEKAWFAPRRRPLPHRTQRCSAEAQTLARRRGSGGRLLAGQGEI